MLFPIITILKTLDNVPIKTWNKGEVFSQSVLAKVVEIFSNPPYVLIGASSSQL